MGWGEFDSRTEGRRWSVRMLSLGCKRRGWRWHDLKGSGKLISVEQGKVIEGRGGLEG